ncbi:MAG: 16S rRNA (guanine(966)-N(2))-methyltransferase RsmD [Candidatus Margulisiibacteriota bacterium]
MRIIGGTARGRQLVYKSKNLRPTSDKVRESLFNIIRDQVDGCRFLDLCAGSGAVGLEALSRGAAEAVFIEKFPKLVIQNLQTTGYGRQSQIMKMDALKALDVLVNKKYSFGIIFLDPPYESDILELSLKKIGASDILKCEGIVVAEHRKTKEIQETYGSLTLQRQVKYGETILSFYAIENRL